MFYISNFTNKDFIVSSFINMLKLKIKKKSNPSVNVYFSIKS